MPKLQITIVGLGLIGASIGLALSQGERDFEIVGHDKDSGAVGQAKKMKAVDRTEWNLISACEGADLLILALPPQAIRETMQAVAKDLKPGAVVLDTASVKVPVVAWADELLPTPTAYIGTNPIVHGGAGGTAAARVDLFDHCTWAICPTPNTSEAAVKTAIDLATRLGSHALFLEPAEHDSLLAGVDHLPALLSAVFMASVAAQPGWREARQLAGSQFEGFTNLTSTDPKTLASIVMTNRENLTRWIDLFTEQLRAWRALMAEGEDAGARLEAAIENAARQHDRWQKQRQSGQWEEGVAAEMPDKASVYKSFLGFGSLRGRQSKEKPEKR